MFQLYVVDQGDLDCFKRFPGEAQDKFLKTYHPGESFGELALLYNVPRAATIIAKTDSILFGLDRQTFNHIVKDSAAKKRQQYEEFLSKVEILKTVDPYERSQIGDALKTVKAKAGERIVKQGDEGDLFFMVEEGQLQALKQMQGQGEKVVMDYKPGDYFGELALLKNQPRAASIVCVTDCTLVVLERESFKRMLGPIEEILKRNAQIYEKYK